MLLFRAIASLQYDAAPNGLRLFAFIGAKITNSKAGLYCGWLVRGMYRAKEILQISNFRYGSEPAPLTDYLTVYPLLLPGISGRHPCRSAFASASRTRSQR